MSGGAVISVLCEDYGAPPCKRPRKEDEPPLPHKSIRNYFSPVSRGLEKGVTSPRSPNIAHYFIKSSPIIENHKSPEPRPPRNGQLPPTPLSRPARRRRLLRRLGEEDGSCSPPGNTGFLGSDTAALLAEICSKAEDLGVEGEGPQSLKRKHVTPGGEAEVGDTTTISFEEFVKSQAESDCASPAPCDPESGQQPSPKTVTIQAQVHLSPPLPGPRSPRGAPTKIASIFCKKRRSVPATPRGDHVIPKRKSNVVIEEEELEIDVEEPLKAKSTAAERQQFMKAFRQAGDTQKPPAKRASGKRRDVTEGADELSSQECEGGEEPAKNEIQPQPREATESPRRSPVLRRSLRRQRADTSSSAVTPVSTPKTPQNSRYKAEVLTVPSDTESPIRMRFTRISGRVSGGQSTPLSDDDAFTPGRKKVPATAKKMNKAKQLVEKAKAIQHKMAAPQRRSARHHQRLSQEPPSSQASEEKTANLRSLNDVLGKKEGAQGHKKEVKKKPAKSAIITIDDGSEVSENSQDEEQFRARRVFLMSGLPDSLKRHIAKTAALREAYALSSLSFQSAVHVQQRDGSDKWGLLMPLCPLLTKLQPRSMNVSDVSSVTLSIGDFTSCSAAPAPHKPPVMVTRRAAFSEAVRNFLLEEIRWSNCHFPVRRFFSQFLKKQADYLALQDTPKPGGHQEVGGQAVDEEGAKRKRKDSPGLKSKRRKEPPRKGRLSRRRGPPHTDPDVLIIEDDVTPEPEGPALEDVLWTEKYQPQSSTELIGNSAAIRKLHSWLRDWKTRAEKEEKRSQMQKPGREKNDTWDAGDFDDVDSDEEDSPLCNTMLVTGPPGVGKTAAVYACAQELGFKVFEVNASCQRSGRQILAQLREATQSHQVDQGGVSGHKPSFFSSHVPGKSPRKGHVPKTVVSSPRKPPMSPRGGKKGLAPKSLANFFKATPKPKPEERKSAPDHGKVTKTLPLFCDTGAEDTQRKSATSLILFEEVDVIFEEDSGFLSAVKTFMSTTKRPVVLTTSDSMFGVMFDGVYEEISFRPPSVVNVATYLQVLCLAENLRTDTKDLVTLLTQNACDVRQSVLQLQFWAQSGGGGQREKALQPPDTGGGSSCPENASAADPPHLPPCHSGCAENWMGLSNLTPPAEPLVPYVRGRVARPDWLGHITRLLSEFQSRNEDFLSANLEFLLPLPLGSAPCARAVERAEVTRRRRLVTLDDSDLFDSGGSGSPGGAVSHDAPGRRTLAPPELGPAPLVYTCLDSLATLADNLSYVDCSTWEPADRGGACNLNWTESRLVDGLCDSLRLESSDPVTAHSAEEIRAHVQGLALHACSARITKALDVSLESGADPTQELTLHVSKSQEEVYFSHPFTTSSTAQSRLSTVRAVLSQRAFMLLGNRQVSVTEYLPALRAICRIERAKEEGKTKRRFLHYLEGIHLEVPKTTLSSLAADFP